MPPTGDLAPTQACALTKNQTGDLLVPRPVLNQSTESLRPGPRPYVFFHLSSHYLHFTCEKSEAQRSLHLPGTVHSIQCSSFLLSSTCQSSRLLSALPPPKKEGWWGWCTFKDKNWETTTKVGVPAPACLGQFFSKNLVSWQIQMQQQTLPVASGCIWNSTEQPSGCLAK